MKSFNKNNIKNNIKTIIKKNITTKFIENLKTKKGFTQKAERIYIKKLKDIFKKNNITFDEAPSQQSKDFRNINNTNLDLEVKKTDSNTIIFNDTCPTKNIYYCIFVTGNNKYKPQCLFITGDTFIKKSPWINNYITEMNIIKNKYARGYNKKKLNGIMSVYPRPTFKADISSLLKTT